MIRNRDGGGAKRRQPSADHKELLASSLPPQNLEAERAVLGCILRESFCLNEVVKHLPDPEHFYGDKHQHIFRAMISLFDSGKPIDVLTLGEELARMDLLIEVGGAPALAELFQETLTAANVSYYARIVHDKAILRNLIHAGTEILNSAYQSSGSPDEILGDAEKKLFSILEKRIGQNTATIDDVLKKAFDRISHRQNRDGGGLGGIPSRFRDLDELTDGWQNSELIVLAARPSIGKTALALNFVEHSAVDCGHSTLFVSLEMSELELAERLLCSAAEVNGHFLRKHRLTSDDMQRLIDAGDRLSKAPLFIDDTPGQTMLRISATARRLKLRSNLKLIVIDYMQLIESENKDVSRNEQISGISRRLKNLSRELQVPVIALSQLNRGVESREGHRPRMSDLRESGSIEQDADMVLLLHRDDAYDPQEKPNQAELIIAKQRNGPVGEVKLTFRKELTRFENFHDEIPAFSGDASEF